MPERRNGARKRLWRDAGAGGQAKVDAIVALSQRTLWVVPWDGVEGYRTLVNSTGLAALPVFTTEAELTEAAQRFGWLTPAGNVAHAEVGARAAFTYARDKNLGFVVVDITSEHSLEISREEIEPLLVGGRARDSNLMAAVVRKSEPGMAAVSPRAPTPPPGSVAPVTRAPTPTPGGIPAVRMPTPGAMPAVAPATAPVVAAPSSLPAGALPPRADSAVPDHAGATGQVLPSVRLFPPAAPPGDALPDKLGARLRGSPGVEWAWVGSASATPAVGVRIDARMRTRVGALADGIAKASGLAIVTLDDMAHFKAAKVEAFVFYPWRR